VYTPFLWYCGFYDIAVFILSVPMQGTISCNGEDGKSETGGASGGSIKLQTGALYGKGKLQVNGGQG
jgi:hypothetical protein